MTRTPSSDDPHAIYMRKWRAENIDKAREIERASQARQRAADPEGFRARARERYARWLAKEGNAERKKAHEKKHLAIHGAIKQRRGLTKADRHGYWLHHGGLCDFCHKPYADPAEPGSWRTSVVDHDHDHCANKIGCIGCVRGQGHRVCNVIEGSVKKALDMGLITEIRGPLAEYLADPPMQRWLRERDAAEDAPLAA